MEFVDILFPPRIAMGAQRKTRWRTTIVQTQSGREFSNQEWSRAQHTYDVGFAVRTATDYDAIVQHFHSVRARAMSFPLQDKLDFQCTADRGLVVNAGGSPTELSLAKKYGAGAYAYNRAITRPVVATLTVYRLRSGATTNITASTTVSATTGAVVIAGGVFLPGDVLSWSGRFLVPCRYDTDELPALIVDRRVGEGGEMLVRCDGISIVEVREGA